MFPASDLVFIYKKIYWCVDTVKSDFVVPLQKKLMTPALDFRRILVRFLARSQFFSSPKEFIPVLGHRWLFAGGKAAGT